MFQHQGIWLPDGEAHFPEWMSKNGEIVAGRGTYQIRKLREALTAVQQFRTAIDIGAHVGLWSMHLAKRFFEVQAFEPVAAFRECFVKNVTGENIVLHDCALGNREGRAVMNIPLLNGGIDSGGTHVKDAAPVGATEDTVPMRTLDSFEIDEVDFIKLDCEGYEHHVLAGAVDTIARCRPAIIVEQKPHKLGPNFGIAGTPAVDLLQSIGMRINRVMSGDYILIWP